MGIKVCPERNRHGEPPSFATLNQTCLKPTRPRRVTPSGTWYNVLHESVHCQPPQGPAIPHGDGRPGVRRKGFEIVREHVEVETGKVVDQAERLQGHHERRAARLGLSTSAAAAPAPPAVPPPPPPQAPRGARP